MSMPPRSCHLTDVVALLCYDQTKKTSASPHPGPSSSCLNSVPANSTCEPGSRSPVWSVPRVGVTTAPTPRESWDKLTGQKQEILWRQGWSPTGVVTQHRLVERTGSVRKPSQVGPSPGSMTRPPFPSPSYGPCRTSWTTRQQLRSPVTTTTMMSRLGATTAWIASSESIPKHREYGNFLQI